jgi:hypothetical protein
MSFNPIEIGRAWIIAANPTNIQKELAQQRYSVCIECSHYKKSRPITHDEHCGVCLCPLSKKIFSNIFNECPKGKWKSVDTKFENILRKKPIEEKNKKTIL